VSTNNPAARRRNRRFSCFANNEKALRPNVHVYMDRCAGSVPTNIGTTAKTLAR
jgi:hypothetical protein